LPYRALVGQTGGRCRPAGSDRPCTPQRMGLRGLRHQPRFGADRSRVDTRYSAGLRPVDAHKRTVGALVLFLAPPTGHAGHGLTQGQEKTMNPVLWVTQAALALLCMSGGAYKAFKFEQLANQMRVLSHRAWRTLGMLEIVCGILLVVPVAASWMPVLTPIAAAVVVLENL